MRAFRANYLGGGGGAFLPSQGACEPLQVVNANIQISPLQATNRVGTNHTLTGHVNVNSGAGFVNAPDGTLITFSIQSGPGVFVGGVNTCNTAGGTGSCTVQITSATTGTTVVRAATDVTVAGVSLHRATADGLPGDSADAHKDWVNARISIAPSATNEVGHAHTFTVTLEKDVGAGFVAAAGETVTVTCTASNGATPTPAGPFTGTTDAAGQFQVTVNSPTPGKDTCHAASTLTIGSATFTVETDGSGLNSPDAVKTWGDANIQLTPATATNPVGTNHALHCHINVNDASGGPFVNAPAGTVCTVAILSGPGTPATQNCSTVGTTGSCDVVITSATPGTTTLQASTDVAVGGVTLHRATGDANVGDSADAHKDWVNARISIAPTATNEVGHAHTFTVTLQKDVGAGFVAAAGETVTVTCTASNGATPTPAGPFTGTTNASGQFQVTVNSPLPGKDTCHAASTLTIDGATITVETNGQNGNSGDAVKTWVDANIQLTPATATNPVGTNHTLHCHINVNDGSGGPFVNAPAGTVCTVAILSGPGTPATQNCSTVGTTGSCDAVITSATPGTTTLQASTDVAVGGVTLHRATGDANVGDGPNAVKNWASARISIAPTATNEVGHAHTFTVTLQKDLGAGFVAAAGETVTVTCTASNGATPTPAGPFTGTTNASGQFQVTVNSPLPGKDTCHAASTLTIDGATITVETNGQNGNSGDAVKTWVDANIQLTPATATNPVGTNHTLHCHINVNDGSGGPFVNAPAGTVCTVAILSGPGTPATQNCSTVGTTGSCDVVITSATPGTTTLQASTDVAVGGVTLHRATGDANVGDGPKAVKNWASARISIAPTATNEVGHAHTFTVTLQKDLGAGFVAAAGETVTVTCTASNGATPTPAGPFTGTTDAAGQFQVTVNSPTPGKDTCHAASTLTIGSATFTVETDGSGLNSPDAVKTWVDANIQLTPATATNPVGTNHTLHCHINVNDGSGGPFVNAPAGTVCTVAILSGPGTPATQNCSTVGTTGSCDAVITSATPGTTTLQASTDVAVGGVTLHRATGDANVGDGPNAVKNWASARISIAPTATNEVGHAHTFTVTLQKDLGAGFVAAA